MQRRDPRNLPEILTFSTFNHHYPPKPEQAQNQPQVFPMQDHERGEGIQADPFSHEKSPESSRRRECRPENRGRRQTTQEVREREAAGEAERGREGESQGEPEK